MEKGLTEPRAIKGRKKEKDCRDGRAFIEKGERTNGETEKDDTKMIHDAGTRADQYLCSFSFRSRSFSGERPPLYR